MMKQGVSRKVFLYGKYAFKFPNPSSWVQFLWGLISNMNERIFGRMKDERLCPVLFSLPGGWLVVMQRAEPLPDDHDERRIDEIVAAFPCVEKKPSSFGIVDDRIVAVDYG